MFTNLIAWQNYLKNIAKVTQHQILKNPELPVWLMKRSENSEVGTSGILISTTQQNFKSFDSYFDDLSIVIRYQMFNSA